MPLIVSYAAPGTMATVRMYAMASVLFLRQHRLQLMQLPRWLGAPRPLKMALFPAELAVLANLRYLECPPVMKLGEVNCQRRKRVE